MILPTEDYQRILDAVLEELAENDMLSEEQQITATIAIHQRYNELINSSHSSALSEDKIKEELQSSIKNVLNQTRSSPR